VDFAVKFHLNPILARGFVFLPVAAKGPEVYEFWNAGSFGCVDIK
jgi:hypothetical protein